MRGAMRLNSLAQALEATRTHSVPSALTVSARVTAAICGPTTAAQSSTERTSSSPRGGGREVDSLGELGSRRGRDEGLPTPLGQAGRQPLLALPIQLGEHVV